MRIFLLYISFFLCLSIHATDSTSIERLEKQSLLYQSHKLAQKYSGRALQWQHLFGRPVYRQVSEKSSVWFTAYGLSILTPLDQSVVQTLASSDLWKIFAQIGIEGIHIGSNEELPAIISSPLGSSSDYFDLVQMAKKHGALVLTDLMPGYTDRGADFLLALQNYKNYPGIYHMVEVYEEDWPLLPLVSENELSKNLSFSQVEQLKMRGYIIGSIQRSSFSQSGLADSYWDATPIIQGVDGKQRRWIYLRANTANQPRLNWLDPTCAAQQILCGDVIESLHTLGAQGVALHTNSFLGVEATTSQKKAFCQAHPLSLVVSDLLAMFIRKMGGFSFQKLNLCLQSLQTFSENGPDFWYDSMVRTGYCHALVYQDTELLKLLYRLFLHYDLQPIRSVHALQNEEPFDCDLPHFRIRETEVFSYYGQSISGSSLRQKIFYEIIEKTITNVPYNFSTETGPCTTLVGLCAAALGVKDLNCLSPVQKKNIQKAHLLLAFFNAMQPGIFAISGWDLVGAYPLEKEAISSYIQKKDYCWMQRGSYDLMGTSPLSQSRGKIPKAKELYGPLLQQMRDPTSFCRQLQKMLRIRKLYHIESATLLGVLDVYHPQLFVLLHELPGTQNLQITAINFGQTPLEEDLFIENIKDCAAIDVLDRKPNPPLLQENTYSLQLGPLSGKVIVFQPRIVKNS